MSEGSGHLCSCRACQTADPVRDAPSGRRADIAIIASSGALLAAGLIARYLTPYPVFWEVLILAAAILSGHRILMSGFASLLRLRFDMSVLISIAAIGAFFVGHGEEGAAVLFLYFVAVFLEDSAVRRAHRSIGSLLELAPDTAAVRRGGVEEIVHVHAVSVGETVLVRPGDRIPLDGRVTSGISSVNQAPITGESMPVTKRPGDEVYAGTHNEEGYLEVRVEKRDTESMIARIAALVEEAQSRRSKTEAFIDRFSRHYTPAVIFLAFAIMALPPLLFGLPLADSFYRALILLVIACPCALALSTPVSMISGITSAARSGVLIKGRDYLESVAEAKAVVFDKTGTLTAGRPEVTDVVGYAGFDEADILGIAAALESRSGHPIAEAILRHAALRGIERQEVSEFVSIPGMGLRGRVGGILYLVGNRRIFAAPDADIWQAAYDRFEDEGKTVILVGSEDRILGLIALMDAVKEDAQPTIAYLRSRGVRTVMLTGDNGRVAAATAARLGLDEYHAGLLPEEKVQAVERLMAQNGHVTMVGDGVNDAPALARASVGIAMGGIGSDTAVGTADIVLMDDRISQVRHLIELSERTMAVVKQNVALSIIVKTSFAALAFPGFVTLWMAVAIGDMGLSFAVIANALRIARTSPSAGE
ncbi:MAG: cadmium-translocating P-type ATPase [Methanomicrobiaceae archaeon]|nr:cadmium-translocating P-type ATPase [Methanomicrobiaceae archaeon]